MKSAIREYKIKITENGPYQVSGSLPLFREIIIADKRTGIPTRWDKDKTFPLEKNYTLCRCGQSNNKPFCDGTHAEINFDGTETFGEKRYLDIATMFHGSKIDLTDAIELCSAARFCHRAGGIWNLIKNSDEDSINIAIQEASDCPSGRLVAWDKKTGNPIEPELEPCISVVEDPIKKVSGPLWIKGRVPIESFDGKLYEIRNRVTLCRCGKSGNKPFCDGKHVFIRFNDGYFLE